MGFLKDLFKSGVVRDVASLHPAGALVFKLNDVVEEARNGDQVAIAKLKRVKQLADAGVPKAVAAVAMASNLNQAQKEKEATGSMYDRGMSVGHDVYSIAGSPPPLGGQSRRGGSVSVEKSAKPRGKGTKARSQVRLRDGTLVRNKRSGRGGDNSSVPSHWGANRQALGPMDASHGYFQPQSPMPVAPQEQGYQQGYAPQEQGYQQGYAPQEQWYQDQGDPYAAMAYGEQDPFYVPNTDYGFQGYNDEPVQSANRQIYDPTTDRFYTNEARQQYDADTDSFQPTSDYNPYQTYEDEYAVGGWTFNRPYRPTAEVLARADKGPAVAARELYNRGMGRPAIKATDLLSQFIKRI